MSKNLSSLSGRKGLKYNLFDEMGKLAVETGIPDKKELARLADEFLVGKANTYGASTFYDFLKPGNKGKKVYVCSGSVCLCAGTQTTLKDHLQAHVRPEEIGEMCCLGRCHENSAFHYNGHNYSAASKEEIDRIMEGAELHTDQYKVESLGAAVLTSPAEELSSLYGNFSEKLSRGQEHLLEEIKNSGLRGRGGAGFPMGLKLQFCRQEDSQVKFIICNADEGDPGAYSDRYLLEKQPHLVLYGMLVSGFVTGASWGIVYIRGEYPESVDAIERAIKELQSHNLLGDDILGSGFSFQLKVIRAQGSYICGEETALINSIEGQRPEVRVRPPYPAQSGLFGKPTVVNNVETLAAIPWIMKNGGNAYAGLGTGKSSGTKLISLDSGFRRPGIYEVDMGTPLQQVVETCGQGYRHPVKALHIGGPLGGMVPVSKIPDLTIDFESFSNHGFLLGHASVVSIPSDFPMVKYLEHLFEFASDESCGKCFPCRLGTKRAEELLQKAQQESYKIDRNLFDDLLHTLETGSLCAHGGGIPLPVRNTLTYFQDELRSYFTDEPISSQ